MNGYATLAIAIVSEVIATSALKASDGFSRITPSVVTVVFYSIAFYSLSLTLRSISVGVAYAIWSALGILLVSAAGYVLFGQRLDLTAMIGMALIVAGVLVLSLSSNAIQ